MNVLPNCTPYPWAAETLDSGRNVIQGAYCESVCAVPNRKDNRGSVDAKLIAAAPELCLALIEAERVMRLLSEEESDETWSLVYKSVLNARAALARAGVALVDPPKA